MNHENTKSKKHEMLRTIFVFLFFRDFVMEVFDSTLNVDYWIFENNKVTTYDQDLTPISHKAHRDAEPFLFSFKGKEKDKH